jgi:hypothetical protein
MMILFVKLTKGIGHKFYQLRERPFNLKVGGGYGIFLKNILILVEEKKII